jgi:hypothetical protein
VAQKTPVNPTWAASLERQLKEIRERLREQDPAEVAKRSGGIYSASGRGQVEILAWGCLCVVSWPAISVREKGGGCCPEPLQAAILQYLLVADGSPLEDTWVSLRSLPHGVFYEQAFQSYSGNLVSKAYRGDLEGFRAAARLLGGEPVDIGDAAFRFWALPRIPLAVVFWSGGDEFPDSAQVLFDGSAGHYHNLEMLAHFGGMLCDRLVRAREQSQKMPRFSPDGGPPR